MSARRIRRDPAEAKRLILDAARDLLSGGGPSAVQMRAVAARVGVTDAAVSHHFGTREQLLEALLRDGGRRLKEKVRAVVSSWTSQDAEIAGLVGALAGLYADGSLAELALALHQSGWRDRGGGVLSDVVDALHERAARRARRTSRTPTRRRQVELTVAALHQALATDPIFGAEFRRSAGMAASDATDRGAVLGWWTEVVRLMVDG